MTKCLRRSKLREVGFTFCTQLEGTQFTMGDVLTAGGSLWQGCTAGTFLRASFRVGFLYLVELLQRHSHKHIQEFPQSQLIIKVIDYQSSRGNSAE